MLTRNQHGHYVIAVTGLNLAGAEEISRMEAMGLRVSDEAKAVLLSESYNALHRLEGGSLYTAVLLPGAELQLSEGVEKGIAVGVGSRTGSDLQRHASKLGYGQPPPAGFQLRIREALSDEQMIAIGIDYIRCLHLPISLETPGGLPYILESHTNFGGRLLNARPYGDEMHWPGLGLFPYLVG